MKFTKNKVLIICAVIILLFLYFIGILNPRLSLGLTSTNANKQWDASFYYLSGNLTGIFSIDEHESKLIVSNNLEKGNINFCIYNENDDLIKSVESNNKIDTIQILNNGIYYIKAKAKNAKGIFTIKVE